MISTSFIRCQSKGIKRWGETNTLQASSHTPQKIKTQWQEIKVYDRSEIEDKAINDDIDQIVHDSFRDANFHAEKLLSIDAKQIVDISS